MALNQENIALKFEKKNVEKIEQDSKSKDFEINRLNNIIKICNCEKVIKKIFWKIRLTTSIFNIFINLLKLVKDLERNSLKTLKETEIEIEIANLKDQLTNFKMTKEFENERVNFL